MGHGGVLFEKDVVSVELYLQVKMKLHLLFLLFTGVVFAPFPKQHQLNWKNPFIDPIWEQLDKETKKAVYDEWLEKEPTKKAMMDYYEASDRRKTADAVAWEQAKQLLKVKTKEFLDALKGVFPQPSNTTNVKIEKEEHSEKIKKVKKKKNEKEMEYTKQLVKDKIKDTYLKFINKYEEKLYKVWTKAEELKENINKYESGYNQQANYNYY